MTAELGHSRTVFLTGPTASGKTALGVALAEHLGAEIVSMDSMALYRRMDIGTAKPSPVQRHRVPHHLIDVLDAWEDCSLTDYLAKAADAAERIRAAGRIALFVGGTPLYLKALLHGVDSGPPPDPELRARLAIEASEHGNAFLHERLAQVDPAAARRIHSNDLRRITRALEVFEKTGRPISASQVHFHNPPDAAGPVYCLDVSRDELYRRIDDRVEAMFRNGLVDEVRELLRLPHPLSRTARQALGYKEVIDHLEGRRDLAETIELVQRRSRQFAKRQLTWFRSLKQCRWLSVKSDQDPVAFAEVIARVALGDFIRRLF